MQLNDSIETYAYVTSKTSSKWKSRDYMQQYYKTT